MLAIPNCNVAARRRGKVEIDLVADPMNQVGGSEDAELGAIGELQQVVAGLAQIGVAGDAAPKLLRRAGGLFEQHLVGPDGDGVATPREQVGAADEGGDEGGGGLLVHLVRRARWIIWGPKLIAWG